MMSIPGAVLAVLVAAFIVWDWRERRRMPTDLEQVLLTFLSQYETWTQNHWHIVVEPVNGGPGSRYVGVQYRDPCPCLRDGVRT